MINLIGWFALIVILIFSFFQFLSYLLNKEWKHVYTAFGNKDYYSVVSKLKSDGIKYRVKTITSQRNSPFDYDHSAQYEIYVKKGTEHKVRL